MGVEFRLGSNDHKVVEDFLASRPAGVAAIVLSPRGARREEDVAMQAIQNEVDVHWDPTTDRLVRPGFNMPGISDQLGVINLAELHTSAQARARLTKVVASATPRFVSTATPPHFVVENLQDATLSLELANRFRDEMPGETIIRPTLTVSAQIPHFEVEEIAASFAAAGFAQVEVRVTPFSGEDDSARKVRTVLAIARAFRERELEVTLGCSGNIGQVAMTLGSSDHYSVGIGSLEHVNHPSILSRQQKPRESGKGFAPYSGVYLNGIALTAPRKIAKTLLEDSRIRSRIGCKYGMCHSDITMPVRDPRPHYLHSRSHEADLMLGRPDAWKTSGERDRLQRALELRKRINQKFLPSGTRELKTRTLASVVDLLNQAIT